MEYSNTHPFSTYDNYNAGGTSNCAEEYHGAWWFDSCSWVIIILSSDNVNRKSVFTY